jgi:type II secretory pathway pseudopilin PulG
VKPSEEGYVMLIAIFLMALLVISLGIAAPQVAKSIQRDKDLETYHRGLQYRRAVQLYYRKFHAYPPNTDALVKTSDIRFLRKKYVDPITGKVDWKPVLYGQNKVPMAMGFFGQPLAGGATSIAGIGPSGGNGLGGSSGSTIMPQGISSIFGGSSTSSTSSSGSTSSPTDFGCIQRKREHKLNHKLDHKLNLDHFVGNELQWEFKFLDRLRSERANLRRRRHRRLLACQPQEIHPHLQEKEPLQRVGVHLRPDLRHANHERWQRWQRRRDRPARQQHIHTGRHPHFRQPNFGN